MAVRIGHAPIDKNRKATGGAASNLPAVSKADAGAFLRVPADGKWSAERLDGVSEAGA